VETNACQRPHASGPPMRVSGQGRASTCTRKWKRMASRQLCKQASTHNARAAHLLVHHVRACARASGQARTPSCPPAVVTSRVPAAAAAVRSAGVDGAGRCGHCMLHAYMHTCATTAGPGQAASKRGGARLLSLVPAAGHSAACKRACKRTYARQRGCPHESNSRCACPLSPAPRLPMPAFQRI